MLIRPTVGYDRLEGGCLIIGGTEWCLLFYGEFIGMAVGLFGKD